jgi:hypothetical protein
MPQQMTAQDVLRELRRLRYSARKKRYLGITWIASQAGYGRTALYNAIITGYVTERMADCVGAVFQNVQNARNHTTRSSLGDYGGGVDPRGGPRSARRPDDGRLRSARQLRSKSGEMGRTAGGRRKHFSSGRMMEAPHNVALVARANKPPAVTDKLNPVKQPLAQCPTDPATIRIEVGRLLGKHLR